MAAVGAHGWSASGTGSTMGNEEPTQSATGQPRTVLGYRPPLDGLRAVAVMAVLAYHGGMPWASGGLLGVDVFFVLSGFLITSLLMAEFEQGGSIRLGAFWARRARRLLPGLFILLVGVALYARFATGGDGVGIIRSDAISTLLYVANWHSIIAGQSYFVQNGPPSPLLHTWSLAIEEQFYLIWPLVTLAVLHRFGRRALSVVSASGAVLSATLMLSLFLAGMSVDRLYYGTDTRAQAIMVGAFLATLGPLTQWRVLREPSGGKARGRQVVLALGLLGAGFVTWAFTALSGSRPFLYLGGFLMVSVATGLVLASVTTYGRSSMARALSLRPVVYVGRISYGVYLYHWPLFLYLTPARTGVSGTALFLLRCAVTLVVAALSYHLVELPIRQRRFLPGLKALVALPVCVAVTVPVLMLATVAPAQGGAVVASGHTKYARLVANGLQRIEPVRPFVDHHPIRIMVYGDSVALTMDIGLHVNDHRWGVDVSKLPTATLGCDLDPNTLIDIAGKVGPATKGCVNWRSWWKKTIDQVNPDVVMLLLGRWELPSHFYKGHWVHVGEAGWDHHLVDEISQGVRILSAKGAKVMLLTSPYIDPEVIGAGGLSYQDEPNGRVNAFNRLLAEVAHRFPHTSALVNVNRMLDPQGHYTSVVDGLTVRWADREHISVAGGEYLQPLLFPKAISLGLAHDHLRVARHGVAQAGQRTACGLHC